MLKEDIAIGITQQQARRTKAPPQPLPTSHLNPAVAEGRIKRAAWEYTIITRVLAAHAPQPPTPSRHSRCCYRRLGGASCQNHLMRRSRIMQLATCVWLGVIALLTLTPSPYPPGPPSDFVLKVIAFVASTSLTTWFTFDVAEFVANVLLFVPLGALLAAQLPPRRRLLAALVGLGVSAVVETSQLLWLPNRVADIRDLISNGLGALLGALLTVALLQLRSSSQQDSHAHAD
ncbi:VanZ family protein [Rathayibacter toxicus]|nr:VanZ family protein [Rathayibacter toxicus]